MASEREQGLITVEFEGDIRMPLVVSEEDIVVGKRFGVGHHADVSRGVEKHTGMEVEITRVNRRWKIFGPIKSVRVERVRGKKKAG